MTEEDLNVPEKRCGFELLPEDFGVSLRDMDSELRGNSIVCCWRPVWKSHDDTDRCIWHADVDEKPLEELIAARTDFPERLDGAILHDIDAGELLSFGGCGLIGAKFDGTSLRDADLHDTDLRGAMFHDVDLKGANINDTVLQKAEFTNVNLIGTNFYNTNLGRVKFYNVDLPWTNFRNAGFAGTEFHNVGLPWTNFHNAKLRNTKFHDVDLRETEFTNATLTLSEFSDTDLSSAKFHDANLREAEFTNATLTHTEFHDADLSSAKFTDTDLRDADLSDADAREASFRHANLQDAVFTRTDCREATFTSALLYETVFSDTRINSKTTFFDPETTFYNSITLRPGCVYEENPLTTDLLSGDDQPLEAARWVYRRLETLHEDNALSEVAREFHISKEEAERALYWNRGEYGPWSVKTLMWYLTRHGESVKRVLTCWGGVILTAGFLLAGLGGIKNAAGTEYALTSLSELGTITGWQELLWNVYFSITTFSTIMDGGLAPVGPWTRIVVAVESLTGALLVALLVFVLGRRVAR
jgi:uncharacterized protein YjbI with pentapeptide repeats